MFSNIAIYVSIFSLYHKEHNSTLNKMCRYNLKCCIANKCVQLSFNLPSHSLCLYNIVPLFNLYCTHNHSLLLFRVQISSSSRLQKYQN